MFGVPLRVPNHFGHQTGVMILTLSRGGQGQELGPFPGFPVTLIMVESRGLSKVPWFRTHLSHRLLFEVIRSVVSGTGVVAAGE